MRLVKRWFREITVVGLRDWLWFVVWLGRDEFHPSLNRFHSTGLKGVCERERRRHKAHEIDLVLSDLEGKQCGNFSD